MRHDSVVYLFKNYYSGNVLLVLLTLIIWLYALGWPCYICPPTVGPSEQIRRVSEGRILGRRCLWSEQNSVRRLTEAIEPSSVTLNGNRCLSGNACHSGTSPTVLVT